MKPSRQFLAAVYTLLLSLAITGLQSQVTITTPYPAPAQPLTRGLDTSLLTVEVNFTSACTNDTVTIGLTAGVTYVGGSVAAIVANTSSGFSIADAGGTLSRPKFVIRGVTAAGSIRFTLKRLAGCGIGASGKDSVMVAGSCGSAIESNGNINSYSLFAPSLSFTSPVTLNNAVLGTMANRTVTITNGGNGCLDTLRYFVVYTAGGIINTATGKAVTANGISFTPIAANGDTLFYKFYGATLFGGDNLLCNGEAVTVVEPIKVVKCDAATTYGARWGRLTEAFCQTATSTTTVTMATGLPNVIVLAGSPTVISGTNMCSDAVLQAIITNNGTETVAGAATAFSITQLLGIDNGESINVRAPLIISNVQLSNGSGGWVALAATGGNNGKADTIRFSQLSTDPDGSAGLVDADGDGQYDDLPAGASVTIRYNVAYTCQAACATSNHSGSPTYQSTYFGQCGAAYTGTKTSASGAGNFGARTLTASSQSGPTDIAGGQTVTLRINANRDFSGLATTAFSCPTDQLVMKLILPKGFSLAAGRYYPVNTSTATNTLTTYTNIASISTNPDTAYIVGKRTAGGNYGAFSFEADVALNCVAYLGSSSLSYTITYICDNSCSCQEQWFCNTYALKAHCPGSCTTGGLTLNGSQFRRTTTGYSSPYAATYLDTATLTATQLRFAMPYDTLQGIFPGVLRTGSSSGSFTNHYFELSYSQLGSANVLAGYTAVLRVKDATTGNVSTAVITAPSSSVVASGKHTITYNLANAGLAINNGDSVTLTPLFGVLNNGSLSTAPTQLSGISTRYYSVASSSQYTCDSWSGELYLSQPGVVRSDGTGSITNVGCGTYTYTASLQYAGASSDIYPKEVRPYIILDSIRTYITSGDNFTGPHTLRSYGNASDGYTASNYIDQVITPASVSADGKIATFINGGSWAKADYVTSTNSGYLFSAKLSTSCASINTGSVFVTYYYKKFGYAHTATVMVADSNRASRTIANSIAALSVSNLTGTVQGTVAQHYWDVRITNTTAYTAPYLWMAADNEGRGIVVDSVKDNTTGAVVTPITYGTGKTWYKIAAAGLANTASRQERIFFHYTSCTTDSLKMMAGWNCGDYPTDPNTTCSPVSQYLKVTPSISQIQLYVSRQAGNDNSITLCSTDSITIVVNSAQASGLLNPSVTVYPPTGLSFSATVPIEYPLGSGIWQNITPTLLSGGGYLVNLSNHTGIGSNGLPGTAQSPGAASRQAKLKFAINADCSFVSGSQLDFFASGNRPCGSAATGSGSDVKSNPINITGATASGSASMDMSTAPTGATCTSNRVINSTITFIGATSQASDTAVYTLPADIVYAGNFTGCSTCSISTVAGSGGTTIVKLKLPAGVSNSTPISYSFEVAATSTSGCGTKQISGQVERNIAGLSCGSMYCSSGKTIIGSNTSSFTIQKPLLTISSFGTTISGCVPGNGSVCTFNAAITNNGTVAASAGTYKAELFCGSNPTPIYTHTIANSIAINATANETFSFMPPAACAGQVVTLKIRFTTASGGTQCICGESQASIAQILPVTLTKFEAVAAQCQVSLHWASTGEESLSRYEVEYSADGVTFHNGGTIAAKGFGDYYFVHQPYRTSAYYRLKMLDKNGLFKYSNTQFVKLNCNGKPFLLVYPNPATAGEALQAIIGNAMGEAGQTLVLTDATGKTVLRKAVVGPDTIVMIPTTKLAAGIYLLTLYQEGIKQGAMVKVVIK